MTPILSVENLSVSFDGFLAVDALNFSVDRDELRAVIGPNGAGKTRPTHGRIQFNDIDITRLGEHEIVRSGVGRKFQTPSTYEDLTVLENLEISYPKGRGVFGSLFFRRSKLVNGRIGEVADEVYLSEHLDIKAGALSHGQKQWLEIGMLLMQEPTLLLLDEPVAGMCFSEREQTADLLKKIAKGRSLVVIEHDMEFVKAIARKVTVLHQGKLLSEGPMEQVQADERVIEVYLGR